MGSKVIICGSRKFRALKKVDNRIEEFRLTNRNVKFKTGRANGVDMRAENYAKSVGFEVEAEEPKFGEIYSPEVYFARNDNMLDDPEVGLVIAFWDGTSKGTKYMITEALRRKINLEVIFDSI